MCPLAGLSAGHFFTVGATSLADFTVAVDMSEVDFVEVAEDTPVTGTVAAGSDEFIATTTGRSCLTVGQFCAEQIDQPARYRVIREKPLQTLSHTRNWAVEGL